MTGIADRIRVVVSLCPLTRAELEVAERKSSPLFLGHCS